MQSFAEENYLKAIYKLLEKGEKRISTTSISRTLGTAPASVTDMLKKLSEKKLISYEKYKGVSLTASGKKIAIAIIRKHRLWEYFLVKNLGFSWDEVHVVAEELEHIKSDSLIERLNTYLGNPRFDPHGDPIPDANGNFQPAQSFQLAMAKPQDTVSICGVLDDSTAFLQYLSKNNLSIDHKLTVRSIQDFDKSMELVLNSKNTVLHISFDVAKNLLVTKAKA